MYVALYLIVSASLELLCRLKFTQRTRTTIDHIHIHKDAAAIRNNY